MGLASGGSRFGRTSLGRGVDAAGRPNLPTLRPILAPGGPRFAPVVLRYSAHACRDPRIRADRRIDRPRPPEAPDRAAWSVTAWTPGGRRPGTRGRGRRHRRRPPRVPRRRSTARDLVVLAGPTDGHHRARRAARTGLAARPRARDRDHGRGEHEGRRRGGAHRARSAVRRRPPDGRPRDERLRGCRRRPVRRPAMGRRPDRRRDLPAVVRVEALAVACGARPIRMDAGDARRGRRRDQPPAAGRRGGARRGGRRARRGRGLAPDWPVARALAAARLARHDAAGARRRGDGRGDRRDERAGDRRRGCATSGTCSTAGWRTSSGRADRTRRPSHGAWPPAREQLGDAGVTEERVLVVPARVDRGRRRLVRHPDRRSRRVRSRRSSATAATSRGRDGGGSLVQAGDPVPRPARRRALLPDAPDAGRRRTRGCTTAGRSASAGTSTRATATSLGGLRREWREELVADFEPAFRLVGLLNDDTTAVGAVHLGVGLRRRRGRPAGDDPRDRQAHGRVRDAARGGRGRRPAGDLEPPAVSSSSIRAGVR